ncbi:DNA polymerase IV [Nocardioides sp.]|uniref:DNA polymerase IV n=1 Tax=Nocardioides sp. TaxID=35761 RepID=UPI0026352A87|nr:DNA polymerase IV [Nocardioides sp.]
MRPHASVLHLDLDAFFAAVEQRDKPSLRGKAVVVGGTGGRGVVATASYEARAYGVRSAMSTREARSRCPHAAFLGPRFEAYRSVSERVMELLRSVSPLVEPLSLDEAFVDLAAAHEPIDLSPTGVRAFAEDLRHRLTEATDGLTASVGVSTSKFMAKIASDLNKPDGLVVVDPGTELELLRPMNVKVIPGVGPQTAERLRRAGIHTVADLETVELDELVSLIGKAHGTGLFHLARAQDDRPIVAERETKSVSVESTYDSDLTDRVLIDSLVARQARQVGERLRAHGLSGRTITLKVRLHDFTTLSRSTTLAGPTDTDAVIAKMARTLLVELTESGQTAGGIRLLGVGVSGLADWIQEDLFEELFGSQDPATTDDGDAENAPVPAPETVMRRRQGWWPGMDVVHAEHGRGWVWGSGRGVVTVRFETAETPAGPVRSFAVDDPALSRFEIAADPPA